MIRNSRRDEKTDHKYCEARLSAYLDGELPARERRAVEQHLKGCEACRWELATLKQTVAWLADLPAVPLPRAFTIPANLVPAPPVRRRWSPVPALQLATALAAVLLFFAAAGDVMLTGWPWTMTAEPMMLQEAAVEQPLAEMPIAKDVELTLEVEAATNAEPYGSGGTAATESATDAAAAEQAVAIEAPAEAPEEAPLAAQQAAPAASARAGAPTEPAAGEVVGGEGTADQEQPTESVVGVETDVGPSLPMVAAPAVVPTSTPELQPTIVPEPEPTAVPTSLPAPTQEPAAVFVPTPTALPTIHPPATDVMQPPAAIVQAPEALPLSREGRDEAESAALAEGETDWAVFWLRIVEYVLGVALVVLLGATMVMMVLRRRARGR